MLKGVVYKIYCNDSSITEFYVGSSCNFKERKRKHTSNCNNIKRTEYNYKVYRYIRENGGWDNWDFEILLETEVDSKEQLKLLYEREFQLELKPELNDRIEGRTKKEYRVANKEKILEKKRKKYKDNKEKIAEKQKKYRENHKEQVFIQQKKWYEKNKEEVVKKRSEKINCVCGNYYSRSNKSRHQKSKKHKKYISSLKTNTIVDL
jgi:hypothetical protein